VPAQRPPGTIRILMQLHGTKRTVAFEHIRLVRNCRMHGDYTTCWATCMSGALTGMIRTITRKAQNMTQKALMLAATESSGVAVGTTTCGGPGGPGGLSTAAWKSPTSASPTMASVARVQFPASNERSTTCQIRRSGAESVRHGSRRESAYDLNNQCVNLGYTRMALTYELFQIYQWLRWFSEAGIPTSDMKRVMDTLIFSHGLFALGVFFVLRGQAQRVELLLPILRS
jgi:hypothetical protein